MVSVRDARAQGLVPVAALALALAVVWVGVRHGAAVAGGADSYGYVSQAHLWAEGRLRVEQPLLGGGDWPFGDSTLMPLGYRQHGQAGLVPSYAPGYPLVMAVFERLGGAEAVYLVVPLLGGLAILATYALGALHAGPVVGLAAAVLLAASPTFLFQLMFPMSDVAAMAAWTVTLLLASLGGPWTTLAAGVTGSWAILTRPNLVPVAGAIGLLLVARAWGRRPAPRWWLDPVLFAAGAVPGCLALALLHNYWYGSPLRSGYGSLEELYAWEHLRTNATRYSQWLLQSQTPAVWLALVAPFTAWPLGRTRGAIRALLVGGLTIIGTVAFCYAFYRPFDAWWYLRFLLPAYPALFVLMAAGLAGLTSRLPAALHVATMALVVGGLAWHGYGYAVDHAAFTIQRQEQRYAAVGRYVDRWLPPRAALLTMQHSGSVRHYSGRLTIRYDFVRPGQLDALIEDLRRRGREPYLLLDAWEEPLFRERFAGRSPLADLDWPPAAELAQPDRVRIWDPRQRTQAAERPPTQYFSE